MDSNAYSDYKASAHKGTYADLNIMTTTLENGVLGYGFIILKIDYLFVPWV